MIDNSNEIPVAQPAKFTQDDAAQGERVEEGKDNTQDIIQPMAVVLELPHDQKFYDTVNHRATVIKWMAIIDSVMCSLFILGGLYWALFIIIVPISGYCASRNYHRGLCFSYLIYLVAVIGFRVSLIFDASDTSTQVTQGVIVGIQGIIVIYAIRFIHIVSKLTDQERFMLINANEGQIEPENEEGEQQSGAHNV